MKKTSITEAKNNFSALIDTVRGGVSVLIVDRGRPVARLEPVTTIDATDDHRLARPVREGIVRPARGAAAKSVLGSQPQRTHEKASGVRGLLEDRRTRR